MEQIFQTRDHPKCLLQNKSLLKTYCRKIRHPKTVLIATSWCMLKIFAPAVFSPIYVHVSNCLPRYIDIYGLKVIKKITTKFGDLRYICQMVKCIFYPSGNTLHVYITQSTHFLM